MFNVRLTESELYEAVLEYFASHLPEKYYEHAKNSNFMIDFDNGEYVICVDGILPDEPTKVRVRHEGCRCNR